MSFSTFTHQYPKRKNDLIFIDVDPKPPIAVVKEECPSSPDEKLIKVKEKGAEKKDKDAEKKEKFQCSECSLTTYSADRMTRHMRKHRGENPFQCNWCQYSTYNSTLFEEHVNIHKGIKPYQCKLCEYRSVSKKYIKKHESRHGTCDKCGFVARDIRLLRRHKRQNGCADNTDEKTKLEKFTCENCNIFYNTPECLKQHIKQHKICPECGEGFSTQVLTKHRFVVHGVQRDIVPKKKFYIVEASSCNQELTRRHYEASGVELETEAPALENTTWDGDTTKAGVRSINISKYDVAMCPQRHPCAPVSCPNFYRPVCMNVNHRFSNNPKFYTFVNHCEMDRFFCQHYKEFEVVPHLNMPGISMSYIEWTLCSAQRYLKFLFTARAASSMGHYGWLDGGERYSKILEPWQRKPGFG